MECSRLIESKTNSAYDLSGLKSLWVIPSLPDKISLCLADSINMTWLFYCHNALFIVEGQGQNGLMVVTLFNSSSPQNEIHKNGTITANDLDGSMKEKQYLIL